MVISFYLHIIVVLFFHFFIQKP